MNISIEELGDGGIEDETNETASNETGSNRNYNLYVNMMNNMIEELNEQREEQDIQAAIIASMNDR